ncbi:MAG: hypothetical protein WBY28_07795, partial [Nitrososphaeraceae archaeon]
KVSNNVAVRILRHELVQSRYSRIYDYLSAAQFSSLSYSYSEMKLLLRWYAIKHIYFRLLKILIFSIISYSNIDVIPENKHI